MSSSNNSNNEEELSEVETVTTVHAGCEITKKRKSSNKKKRSSKSDEKLANVETVGDSPAGKKGSKGAKGKGKKDKSSDSAEKGPKRALSAYMYFAKDIRASIKTEQPELTFGELTKAIAARWAIAAPEQKAPYEELAAADRERYQTEKAASKALSTGQTAIEQE